MNPASILNHPLDIADDPLIVFDYVETNEDKEADTTVHAMCVTVQDLFEIALRLVYVVLGTGADLLDGRISTLRNP